MYNAETHPTAELSVCVPTILRVCDVDSQGESVVKIVHLESLENPLAVLRYEDFSIQTLLRSGVDLKSLQIQSDHRLGIDDSEIEAFNQFIDKHIDKVFTSKEK